MACDPCVLVLGDVRPGGRAEAAVRLTNRGGEPVTVAQVETSCDCLTVRLDEPVLAPKGVAAAVVRLDLSHEPNFRGDLSIDVRGFAGDGRSVFTLTVKVSASG